MTVVNRDAVRAILLTPTNELLLMQIQHPETGEQFWITPGGGIEKGEEPMSGLRRELYEELGLEDFTVGTHAWDRTHRFTWEGRDINQRESFYIVNIVKFIPTFKHMPNGPELRAFKEFKWWSLKELEISKETFAPKNLFDLLSKLVGSGPPSSPTNVEI